MSEINRRMLKLYDKLKEELSFRVKYNKASLIKAAIITVVFVVALFSFLISGHGKDGNNDAVISQNGNHSLSQEDVGLDNTGVPNGENTRDNGEMKFGNTDELMYIDVEGAVNSPGVVEVEIGSRVFHAVEKAGGLKQDADTTYINLAAELCDGDKIYVPSIYDEMNSITAGVVTDMIKEHNSSNSIIGNNYENGIVNINTATNEELQTLPGIGPSTAAKIIEYRNQYGSFRKTEDLLNISGIGEKTLEKFQNRLCV